MKRPRLTIARLMSLVLLIALNLGASRAIMAPPFWPSQRAELIVFGALPMTNVLIIGLIMLLRSRPDNIRRRAGLLGFEVFGTAALCLFLGCSLLATDPVHEGFGMIFQAMHIEPGLLKALGVTALILLPQVALGLLGGWLNRTYSIRVQIIVVRREQSAPRPGAGTDRLVASGLA